MAGFDAGAEVDPLDYDFTTIKALPGAVREILKDAKGTIPEPSNEQVNKFLRKQRSKLESHGVKIEDFDPADQIKSMTAVAKALATASPEDIDKMASGMVDAVAELCGGTPTREQIDALPQRIQTAFFGWLMGKLTSPESAAGGTKPSLAVVRAG
jgi:hypothetical protein